MWKYMDKLKTTKSLVIIPVYNRPEFLQVCLNYIQAADGYEDNYYFFAFDAGSHEDNYDIVKDFEKKNALIPVFFPIFSRELTRRYSRSNSYNILDAYRTGYRIAKNNGLNYIHMIEDDIFIAKDYFYFAAEVWKRNPDIFCLSSCLNQNLKQELPFLPDTVYPYSNYQSLAVSFSLSSLAKIIPHANEMFYENPVEYIRAVIPKRINTTSAMSEQDGLISELIANFGWTMLYPCVPRATHRGWVSYHRKGTMPKFGTFDEKVEFIRTRTAKECNRLSHDYKDYIEIDFNGYGEQDFQTVSLSDFIKND